VRATPRKDQSGSADRSLRAIPLRAVSAIGQCVKPGKRRENKMRLLQRGVRADPQKISQPTVLLCAL
jgi:hypothetical protein